MRRLFLLIVSVLTLTACHRGVRVEGVAMDRPLADFASSLCDEHGYRIDDHTPDGYTLSGTYYGYSAFVQIESDERGGVGRVLYDLEDVPHRSSADRVGFDRIYADFCSQFGEPDTYDTFPHPAGGTDIRCSWEPGEDTHIHMDYERMTDGSRLSHELCISYWKI